MVLSQRHTHITMTTQRRKQLCLGSRAGSQWANKILRTLQHPENSPECTRLHPHPCRLIDGPHLLPPKVSKSTTNRRNSLSILRQTPRKEYLALHFFQIVSCILDRSRRPLPACSAPNSSPTAALRFCAVPSPSYIILPQLSVMGSLSYQANWLSSLVSIFF